MYTVICDGAYLHSPEINEYRVIDPTVTLEANKVGRFEFTILANHPIYSAITRLKSLIEVYDDGVLLFRGRPLNDSIDIYNSQTILCVGELDYLHDTLMPPYNFTGGISSYLTSLINNHNSQVESYKHFALGVVTVTDSNNYIVRSNEEYSNTWEEINDKLINNLGGYIVLRREGETNYIDYLQDALYTSPQEIELTKNILDYQQEINANDIVTIMIPLGAKLKDEQGNDTGQRLTIESVNGGISYVENANGIAKWGRIWSVQIWDDVTDPNNLKSKAQSTLGTLVNLGVSITIKAIDLSLVDSDIPRFRHLEYVRVKSLPHQIDEMMLIKKQTIKLDDPTQNTIELGVEYSSFSDKQLQANNIIKKVYSNYVTNEVVADIREITTLLQSSITQLPNDIHLWVMQQTYSKEVIDESLSEIQLSVEGIRLEVSQLGGYNIISNAIGTYGTMDWTFRSEPFHAKSTAPYAVINAEPIFAINTNGPIMRSVESNSAAKTGFRFWHEGLAFSKYAIVESGSEYSLHTKVKGSGILRFKLREYTSPTPTNVDAYHKETLLATSIVNNSYTTLESTLRLETNTICVVLVVESDVDIYTQQYAEFTDTSFNIGAPKPYGQSLTDVNNRVDSLNARVEIAEDAVDIFASRVQTLDGRVDSAFSQLTVQAGQISSKVGLNGVISAINQSPETIKLSAQKLSLEGLTTINNKVKIHTDGTLEAVDAKFTGTVNAVNGSIGNFQLSGGILSINSTRYSKFMTEADVDRLFSIIRGEIAATESDWVTYDLNDDGVLDIVDAMFIRRALLGNSPNPIPLITSLRMGDSKGTIEASMNYANNEKYRETRITPTSIRSSTVVAKSLFIPGVNGQYYEIMVDDFDPNNLKVRASLIRMVKPLA